MHAIKSSVPVKLCHTADLMLLMKPGCVQYCRQKSDTLQDIGFFAHVYTGIDIQDQRSMKPDDKRVELAK
jgi:hypothetical protein